MKLVYLLVGVPSSGKSWVSDQLTDRFSVIEQDKYKDHDKYVEAIVSLMDTSNKPILANTPFSMNNLMKDLREHGAIVRPVFIIEPEKVLKTRYKAREGRDLPQGHLTRQQTFLERATTSKCFYGTSKEVLSWFND